MYSGRRKCILHAAACALCARRLRQKKGQDYYVIAALTGFLAGLFLPLQTSINTNLRQRLGMPARASLANFLTAIPLLLLLTYIIDGSLSIPVSEIAKEPLWIWTGGILGAVYVTGNILLLPRLGSVSTVVLPILGQVFAAMVIDQFGLFNSIRIPVTPLRAAGVALVLSGVFIIVITGQDKEKTGRPEKNALIWLWRGLGVLIGILSACQTAINTQLGRIIESPQKASLISFLTGSAALLIVLLITRAKEKGDLPGRKKTFWWMWTGGLIGAAFVLITVYIATAIGTGMAVIVSLVGMIIGSMVIDSLGILGVMKRKVGPLKIFGAVIMLGGACMTYLV